MGCTRARREGVCAAPAAVPPRERRREQSAESPQSVVCRRAPTCATPTHHHHPLSRHDPLPPQALPVTLGGELTLPDQARLRVVRTTVTALAPRDLVTIAASPAGTAGALASVYVDANSTDYSFLEACLRLTADGGPVQFLSSGTEDVFYSASYVDEGAFAHVSQAGVSFKDGNNAVSMWKRLDSRDFIPWSQSMLLQVGLGFIRRAGQPADSTMWPPVRAALGRKRVASAESS